MIVANDMVMPGMSSKLTGNKVMQNYSVKYMKADLDDMGQMAVLEEVETRAIRGDDIVLVEKSNYVFLERYFIILKYLEKTES
jgi:hypothetical protein